MFPNQIKSAFFKNVLLLSTGSVFAQLIIIITSPFITRIFSEEQIGIYTYIISFASVFSGIVNGRYDLSIVTEHDGRNVLSLIKLSFIVGLIISIISAIIFFLYVISSKIENINLLSIALFGAIVLSYSLINILSSFNNRLKEYKVISVVYMIRTFVQNVGAIILGLFSFGYMGLLIPYVAGQFLGVKKQYKSLLPYWSEFKSIHYDELKKVALIHKKQFLFSLPATLISSFSYVIITILIEKLFNFSVVGYYSISVRLLGLPLSVIGINIARVYCEKASREYEMHGQFISSFRKVSFTLFILAIFFVVFLYFFAEPLCGLFFGKEWVVAGTYIIYLSPMFGIKLVVSTLMSSVIIVNKQTIELKNQLLFLVAALFSVISYKAFDLTEVSSFLLLISVSYSVVYLLFYYQLYQCAKGDYLK